MTTLSTEHRLTRLCGLLEAELALARELKPLMLLKQQALMDSDVLQLAPLSERELALASRFTLCETERQLQLSQLAQACNVAPEQFSLEALVQRFAGQPQVQQLGALAAELKSELRELQWINDDNRHLTQNLIDYSSMLLRLAAHANGEARYGPDGQFSARPSTRALVDDHI